MLKLFRNEINGILKLTTKNSNEIEKINELNEIKRHVNNFIKNCRHLVGSFKHSASLTTKLREQQNKLNNDRKIKLVQDVSMRWNSTYDMLDSILVNQTCLNNLNADKNIKNYVPSSSDFFFIDELCKL